MGSSWLTVIRNRQFLRTAFLEIVAMCIFDFVYYVY
jgi:hypothetical protein